MAIYKVRPNGGAPADSITEIQSNYDLIKKNRAADLAKIPTFAEYVDAPARIKKLSDQVNADYTLAVENLLNNIDSRISNLDSEITLIKYPNLGKSETFPQAKLYGAIEYNSALQILNNLTEYPVDLILQYYKAGRYDLTSALIDEVQNLNFIPHREPSISGGGFPDKSKWQTRVNEIYRESGVMDLLVEQLQLRKLQTQIRIEFGMSMSTQPASNSNRGNVQKLLAAGISSQMLQQRYDQQLAILNE